MKCKKCGAEMKPMAVETVSLKFCTMPPLTDCDECEKKLCGSSHVYYKCLKCLNGVWT